MQCHLLAHRQVTFLENKLFRAFLQHSGALSGEEKRSRSSVNLPWSVLMDKPRAAEKAVVEVRSRSRSQQPAAVPRN